MPACKGCGKEFRQNRPFQVFCTSECKGVYFRHKYKLQAVKDAEDRLNGRRKVNGNGGHKQKQGLEEVLAEAPLSAPPTHEEICAMADLFLADDAQCSARCPVCHGRKEDDMGGWCVGCGGLGIVPAS